MAKVNLYEYLFPQMEILFLALNAPDKSNKNKHWFSNNLSFWNVLLDSGLITERISNPLEGDVKVFGGQHINYKNWVYGVTDLNRTDVETNSQKVKVGSIDVERILNILDNSKVNKLCIVHSKVAEAFEKYGLISIKSGKSINGYGLVGNYKHTEIYEVPFHNASIPNKAEIYAFLVEKN
jgi:hypothetical protein